MIEIKIDDKGVNELLTALQHRLTDLSPVMKHIAGIMEDAVKKNFKEEGRPKWKPSGRADKRGGKTLQDTGLLAASITSSSDANTAAVGTNRIYAAIHQFGGKTSAHKIRPRDKKALFWPGAGHPVMEVNHPGSVIPARPFLSLTDGDVEEIKRAISEYLTK